MNNKKTIAERDPMVYYYSVQSRDITTAEERKLRASIYERNPDGTLVRDDKGKVVFVKEEKKIKKIIKDLRYLANDGEIREIKDGLMGKVEDAERSYFFFGSAKIDAIQETTLSRLLGCKKGVVNEQMIVVESRSKKEPVIGKLIRNGFNWKGRHYIFFGAGAGQMRTQRNVFVDEAYYTKEIEATILGGLTMEDVNTKVGGKYVCSNNKFMAYKSLNNSNTIPWEEYTGNPNFDLRADLLDRMIVIDDFETTFPYEMMHIDNHTLEYGEIKEMDITVPHTDGWGMMLPNSVWCDSKKEYCHAFTYRGPWFKGLFVTFEYDRFIKEKNGNPIVKDVWGDEHHILEEDIRFIATASQFKLWKAYRNWEHAKQKFCNPSYEGCGLSPRCTFGICVEEREDTKFANMNYQMVQTIDIPMEDVEKLLKYDFDAINSVYSNVGSALRVAVGVNTTDCKVAEASPKYNWYQKCFVKYPMMINNRYTRKQIHSYIDDKCKKMKSGGFTSNGYYRFLSPDAYAVCEWLFLGIDNPNGILPPGVCYIRDYNPDQKIDILRAPHLYKEHCIRESATGDVRKECANWFKYSHSLFVSCHDNTTKIINADRP